MNSLEKEKVYNTYQKIAEHFSNTRHYIWPNTKLYIDSIKPNLKVADIGCGNGRNMYRKDIEWYGMDFCDKFVDLCNSENKNVVLGNILDIPFSDNEFDYTICIAVIHHLSTFERRLKSIQELIRITKPKGKIYLQVWCFNKDKYDTQEAIVEWNLQKKYNGGKKNIIINRYYHLFLKDELENMIPKNLVTITKSIEEHNNWIVELEKK
jgi:ubiquinone/menaquinone biosynthesis C-methylase UbiE